MAKSCIWHVGWARSVRRAHITITGVRGILPSAVLALWWHLVIGGGKTRSWLIHIRHVLNKIKYQHFYLIWWESPDLNNIFCSKFIHTTDWIQNIKLFGDILSIVFNSIKKNIDPSIIILIISLFINLHFWLDISSAGIN